MSESTIIYNGLEFQPFVEQDIEVLTPIMKRAFDYDAKIHLGKDAGGPEGYDNGDFFRKWFLHKDATSFKISKNGSPIGAINLWIKECKINYLGNIFVNPDLQDKGIGKAIATCILINHRIYYSKKGIECDANASI